MATDFQRECSAEKKWKLPVLFRPGLRSFGMSFSLHSVSQSKSHGQPTFKGGETDTPLKVGGHVQLWGWEVGMVGGPSWNLPTIDHCDIIKNVGGLCSRFWHRASEALGIS